MLKALLQLQVHTYIVHYRARRTGNYGLGVVKMVFYRDA